MNHVDQNYLYLISCFGTDLPRILSAMEWSFTSGTLQSCATARAVCGNAKKWKQSAPSSETSEMEVSVCVFALLFFKQGCGICFRLNPWENSSEFNNLVILTPLALVQSISIWCSTDEWKSSTRNCNNKGPQVHCLENGLAKVCH